MPTNNWVIARGIMKWMIYNTFHMELYFDALQEGERAIKPRWIPDSSENIINDQKLGLKDVPLMNGLLCRFWRSVIVRVSDLGVWYKVDYVVTFLSSRSLHEYLVSARCKRRWQGGRADTQTMQPEARSFLVRLWNTSATPSQPAIVKWIILPVGM